MNQQPADQRFRKRHRLHQKAEFDRVFQEGVCVADPVLVVHGRRNQLEYSRLGLSIARQVGGAVVRNRWKRLIREAFRLQRHKIPTGLDLVVRPRRGAECDFHAVQRSLPRLARRVAKRLGAQRQ